MPPPVAALLPLTSEQRTGSGHQSMPEVGRPTTTTAPFSPAMPPPADSAVLPATRAKKARSTEPVPLT